MTIEEFKNQSFRAHMQVRYDSAICDVWSVDFGEFLILIAPEGTDSNDEEEKGRWVRCENVEITKE